MNVGYVTEYDSSDIKEWSGLGFFMEKSLRDAGANIERIGNLKTHISPASKLLSKAVNFRNKNDRWIMTSRSESIARKYGEIINEAKIEDKVDCIFSPSSFPIAYLNTRKPKVFFTDATFHCMLDYYPSFTRLSNKVIKMGHAIEKQSLDSCALAIYSSEWAAASAINFYKTDSSKVAVLPFGANNDSSISSKFLNDKLTASSTTIEVLFIGVDWDRKGGDIVIDTCKTLISSGYDVKLHIVGLDQNTTEVIAPFIINYGFVDKTQPGGAETFDMLFKKAHFLFAPSLADCTPVVFSEAASYGVPVITYDTGGISSIIKDNYNGLLLPAYATATDFYHAIINLWNNKKKYSTLSKSSLKEYEARLNWKTTGTKLMELIKGVAS